jgi:hypothetical protein
LRYTQRNGKASTRMTRAQSVVWAFRWFSETGKAAFKPNVFEIITATRYQLMAIHLVGGVPHDAVPGAIKDAVKGQSQFYNTQIGCKVTASFGYYRYYCFPNFLGQLIEFSSV